MTTEEKSEITSAERIAAEINQQFQQAEDIEMPRGYGINYRRSSAKATKNVVRKAKAELRKWLADIEPTEIQPQKSIHADASTAIRDGNYEKGVDILYNQGWIVECKGNPALLAEYAKAIEETTPDGQPKSVILINAKHKDAITLAQSQSTVADISLAFLDRASLAAMPPVQLLVLLMISRGLERSTVFTDLSRDELLHAIERG